MLTVSTSPFPLRSLIWTRRGGTVKRRPSINSFVVFAKNSEECGARISLMTNGWAMVLFIVDKRWFCQGYLAIFPLYARSHGMQTAI